ncbi:MAG: hypothetical protein ACOCV1_00150 [Bacillota bacterium]
MASKNVKTFIILAFLISFMTVFVGFIGFGKGGFNQRLLLEQLWVYGGYGIGAAFVIFLIYTYVSKNSNYGDWTFFNSTESLPFLPKKVKSFLSDPIQLIIIILIFAISLGFVANFFQQTYFGVGTLEQQFTAADGVLYNWLLVVSSENLAAAAFSCIMILTFYLLIAKRVKMNKVTFIAFAMLILVLSYGIFGFINHQMRYGSSDEDILKVIGFWSGQGLTVALTGSFLTGWILHGVNNTYVKLNQIFANDILIFYVIGTIIFLVILLFAYRAFLKKK